MVETEEVIQAVILLKVIMQWAIEQLHQLLDSENEKAPDSDPKN